MGKDALYNKDKKGYLSYIFGFLIGAIVTAVFILIFALVMYLSGAAFKYAPVFATLSVAIAAFFTAKMQGSKGLLVGAVIGGIAFILITLVSLIVNSGGITLNTLFHFIIIMLSSLIGGIIGVNKGKSHKYI